MAFVVETGSGSATANSYGAVADANTYHADRGNVKWDEIASSSLKEDALVRASDYVDRRFGRKFRGTKGTQAQAMQWPRLDAYDDSDYQISSVPEALKKAIYEYAMRSSEVHELSPDPPMPVNPQSFASGFTRSTSPTGQADRFREKLGPLEEETRFRDPSRSIAATGNASRSKLVSDFNIPEYPAADLWLEELLRAGTTTRLVRG